jgi:hypothetical protein
VRRGIRFRDSRKTKVMTSTCWQSRDSNIFLATLQGLDDAQRRLALHQVTALARRASLESGGRAARMPDCGQRSLRHSAPEIGAWRTAQARRRTSLWPAVRRSPSPGVHGLLKLLPVPRLLHWHTPTFKTLAFQHVSKARPGAISVWGNADRATSSSR